MVGLAEGGRFNLIHLTDTHITEVNEYAGHGVLTKRFSVPSKGAPHVCTANHVLHFGAVDYDFCKCLFSE